MFLPVVNFSVLVIGLTVHLTTVSSAEEYPLVFLTVHILGVIELILVLTFQFLEFTHEHFYDGLLLLESGVDVTDLICFLIRLNPQSGYLLDLFIQVCLNLLTVLISYFE